MISGKYFYAIAMSECLLIACDRYKSYGQVIKTLLKTTGPKAFFNGIAPAMARAFPANAATFFAYEMAMKAMQ